MKTLILTLIMAFLIVLLSAQSVEHLRVRYTADSLYVITFDLRAGAAPDKEYRVILTAQLGEHVYNPLSATGAGIFYPIPPGKGYRILWAPAKEGLETKGWGIRLRLLDPDPRLSRVKKPVSDYPLVIAASYVLMFSILWIVNLIN